MRPRSIYGGSLAVLAVAIAGAVNLATVETAAAQDTSADEVTVEDLVAVDLVGNRLRLGMRTTDHGRLVDPLAIPQVIDVAAVLPGDTDLGLRHSPFDPGTELWVLDGPGGDPPTWDTTAIAAGALGDDRVTLELVAVDGPGHVAIVGHGPEDEPEVALTSQVELPDTHHVTVGTTADTTWAFDAAGTYTLHLAASAMLATGRKTRTEASYLVTVTEPTAVADAATTTTTTPPAVEDEEGLAHTPEPPITQTPATETTPPTTMPPVTTLASPENGGIAATAVPAAAAPGGATPENLSQPIATEPDVVLDDVHVDVGVRIIDGSLRMLIKDGTDATTPVWRTVEDVTLHAKAESRIVVPEGDTFSFLGAPGEPSWVLPQVQRSGLLWPGWNTEEVTSAEVSGDITWTLVDMNGPGEFALFVTDSFGLPDVFFDTSDGLPDSVEVPLGTHAHGNWAFSARGRYELTFETEGRLASGNNSSDHRTLTVTVVDAPEEDDDIADNDEDDTADNDDPDTDDDTADDDADDDDTADADEDETADNESDNSGEAGGTGKTGGSLPLTGAANLSVLAGIGAGLITAGTIAVRSARSRRRRADTMDGNR